MYGRLAYRLGPSPRLLEIQLHAQLLELARVDGRGRAGDQRRERAELLVDAGVDPRAIQSAGSSTVPVTMDEMLIVCKAVRRGTQRALVLPLWLTPWGAPALMRARTSPLSRCCPEANAKG